MKIEHPLFISSRLMTAIKIADSVIHIEPLETEGNRVHWKFIIDQNGEEIGEGQELRTLGNNPKEAMSALISFLSAAAEAYAYGMAGRESENADLFNPKINEWAYQNSDELQMVFCDE